MDKTYKTKKDTKTEGEKPKMPYNVLTCGPHEHPDNHEKRLNEYYKNLESNLQYGN
jgi:hypothetical protein